MIKSWTYLGEYQRLKEEILKAVQGVFDSGRLILGERVAGFERNFADYCGRAFGIGVNSGTDALFLALKALVVGPQDEVITVANTAVPTVAAIRATGARPVFVDIVSETYLMDVRQVESLITPKTKVVLPVHLYGQAVAMDRLLAITQPRGIKMVEDCAQAHGCLYRGKRVGSFGEISAFSFYPTKILGAYGDAGMCVTDSPGLAQRLRQLRMYGMKQEYYSHIEGYNSRLDEVQAAILDVKLKYLQEFITGRQRIAQFYDEALKGLLVTPVIGEGSSHTYYLYVVRHPERDRIIADLKKEGVEVGIHFPHPIHLMEAYRFLEYRAGDLPVTERAAKEIFSLPIYPDLSEEELETIVTALKKVV